MALTKIRTGGITADAVDNTILKLDDDFALTGTVTGAGVSTATSTLPSEGGAATTVVAQGLAKAWINFEGDGTIAISDSFNVTSITDRGSGLYTITIANDMSNALYSITGNGVHDTSSYVAWCAVAHDTGMTAGAAPVDWLGSNDTPRDIELAMTTIHGDLA